MAWILVTQNQQVRERKLIAAAVSPLSCLHPWPRPLVTTHWSHNTDDFTSHTQLRLRPTMLQMLQTLSLLDKVQ